MGMFDNLYVHKSLLEECIRDTHIIFEPNSDGYCYFQTKDLDNALISFYIREDGSFCYEYQEQEWVEIDPKDREHSWLTGYMKEVGDPVIILDNRSVYIDFYDVYLTEQERVYVTFTAHIKNGKLADTIKLKKLKKTDLEKEAIETKKGRAEWDKVSSTWQWRLATFLFNVRNRVNRLFYPLNNKLNSLDCYLREQAKKGTSLESN